MNDYYYCSLALAGDEIQELNTIQALSCTVLDFVVVKQNETFAAYDLALLKNWDLWWLKNLEINKIAFVTAWMEYRSTIYFTFRIHHFSCPTL